MSVKEVFYIVGIVFLIVLGSVVVRIGFSFDINKFMEERRKRGQERLRMSCPHTEIYKENGELIVRSLFISPYGTTHWICSRCGTRTESQATVDQVAQTYAENPQLLLENEKQFRKLAKKYYRL